MNLINKDKGNIPLNPLYSFRMYHINTGVDVRCGEDKQKLNISR